MSDFIIDGLFSVARSVSDTDINEINKLKEKAVSQTADYHNEMPGLKGRYAKLRDNWIFGLIFMLLIPIVSAKFIAYKQKVINSANPLAPKDEDFDDEDEEEYARELARKYNIG